MFEAAIENGVAKDALGAPVPDIVGVHPEPGALAVQ